MDTSTPNGSLTYFNPVRVISGEASLDRLGEQVPARSRVLIVTTKGATARRHTAELQDQLHHAGTVVYDGVTPNPELDDLDAAAKRYRRENITHIVGFGGGSAIDAAKALSVALAPGVDKTFADALRGTKPNTWQNSLPVIAIPTTSGTGAEVTPFATVWDHAENKKHSIAGDAVFPAIALLDPTLTLSLPSDQTLFTGLDATSHALESLWNKNRSPMSSAYAIRALALIADTLRAVLADPTNLHQRARMQFASCLAGLAICQTRTAIAHSISYPITLHFGVPHGLACSFTLRRLLELNLDSLTAMAHEHVVLKQVLQLLQSLPLAEKFSHYAKPEDVLRLTDEMHTKGRAENFTGTMGADLTDLLGRSLGE